MAAMNPCTNCGEPVAERRPSSSGTHWCIRAECQAAKQKFYRRRRAESAEQEAHPLRMKLITDLVTLDRTACTKCGLANALPGWYHRDETGLAPCFGTGSLGKGLGAGYLDAIHPERAPGMIA